MSYYRSSTSFLAIIEYWNQKKLSQYRQIIPPDWDVYFYPAGLLYVRALTVSERVHSGYDGDVGNTWYGAFTHDSARLQAVSDSYHALVRSLKERKVRFVLMH